jgi:hypothetical protein
MLRSPLLTAFDELERVTANAVADPQHAISLLRFENIGLPVMGGLLLASWLLPAMWVMVLTLMSAAVCAVAERVRLDDNRERKEAYRRNFPEQAEHLEPKDVVAERARALGLDPDHYEGDEELVLATGRQLHVTQLGQVVRQYAHAKPMLAEYQNKVMLPCVPPEDGGDPEFCRQCTEGKEDIPPVSAQQAEEINSMAPLRTRLMVKNAIWRGRGSESPAAWTPSAINPSISGPDAGVVVWDIPCSSHPALQRMYDLYVEQMAQELQPVGPAWVRRAFPFLRAILILQKRSYYQEPSSPWTQPCDVCCARGSRRTGYCSGRRSASLTTGHGYRCASRTRRCGKQARSAEKDGIGMSSAQPVVSLGTHAVQTKNTLALLFLLAAFLLTAP